MKKLYGVLLLTLLLLSFTAMSHASVVREYQTNYGIMILTFDGSDVSGSYSYEGGQISGMLEGNTMPCTWSQNNGSGNCIASFSNNFKHIDLKWNYAGETDWKGDWGGTLIRQRGSSEPFYNDSPRVRVYDTNYGAMTLHFDGSEVSGSYTYQGGKISGTLEGDTMPCSWSQNNGSGSCIATFSNNFRRIDLKWNYAGETGWKGDWGGTLRR